MNLYARIAETNLRCLSSKVMSHPVRHAAINNPRKRCLLLDSLLALNSSHHQRVHRGQAVQPVVLPIAHRAIDPEQKD
jgi:hypothetical protein